MPEVRRRFDADFHADAVRIVTGSGGPIAQVARNISVNAGMLLTGGDKGVLVEFEIAA